jgi:hypothetical protein
MIKLEIDTHFAEKGISVRYNTLGNNEQLVRSYLQQFQKEIDNSEKRKSEYVKLSCYSNLYTFEPRPKYTGFEGFKNLDNEFRKHISPYVNKPQHSSIGFVIDPKENNTSNMPYKEALIASLKTLQNPILYLSGGMDSELVAYALLEANVRFIPVIFEWTDKHGNIKNLNELKHAYRFCKDNGLIPQINQIDIETLWNTEHFKKLAIDLQISSPQLVTHAYMIEMMSVKYPHSTHLFGGEVRFKSNYIMDNGDYANLVFLNKVSPVGYNNVVYEDRNDGFQAGLDLNYFGSTGEFQIVSFGGNPQGSPISGLFTTTPAFQYQFRNTSVNIIIDEPGGGQTSYTPGGPDPTYANIASLGTSLCGVLATTSFGFTTIGVQFGLEVRSTTEPAIVVASTITLYATNDLQ